ncbi:leucine-rich repeat domain-containing protein [Microscilla marina]|nr:leucine-rich repeat domain-containing protein [Microscilla marina]
MNDHTTMDKQALVTQLIEENIRTQAPTLDLGRCGLGGTEATLGLLSKCTHLKSLNFSNVWFEHNPANDRWEKRASSNEGEKNSLIQVPDCMPGSLEHLRIAGHWPNQWKIEDIGLLQNLPELRAIDLSDNRISDLKPLQNLANLQMLDMSDNRVADLTPLQNLPGLQSIVLSKNKVRDLTPLQHLTGLHTLLLHYNKIGDLAPLQHLTCLTMLSLHHNKISDLAPLQKLRGLLKLDLSNNQLDDLHPLKSLNSLQSLVLRNNQISDLTPLQALHSLQLIVLRDNPVTDLTPLQSLRNLQSLDLRNNQISDLTPLQNLSSLQSIDLRHNPINDLLPLQNLPNLQSIDLKYNHINDLAPLQNLPNLESIDLSDNQISDLTPLQNLSNLQSIDLSNNQVNHLASLQYLPNLESIDLSDNQINDLAPLQNLGDLQSIDLSNNQIHDLTPLQNLPNLESIDLSDNQISDLTPLQNLGSLQSINLRNNQVSDLSPLQALHDLQAINLSDNQISDLAPLQKLPHLKSIDLRDNQIEVFPEHLITNCPQLTSLHLYHNPIQGLPPEIYNQGECSNKIRHYFQDLNQGKVQVYQAKVVLVGNGRVGKTSLVRRWLDQRFDVDEPSTHAIQLRQMFLPELAQRKQLDQVQIQVWDFGGQDIYHATHQLFMQTKAVFVLVWDWKTQHSPQNYETLPDGSLTHYANHPLDYWLNYTHTLGKRSPVLVVQTKAGKDGRKLPSGWSKLQEKYHIKTAIAAELSKADEDDNGMGEFKEALYRTIRQQIKKACTDLPEAWWLVRLTVEEMAKTKHTLSREAFAQLCIEQGVSPDSIDTVQDYLHHTGVFFYRVGLFDNQIILDQRWAIEAVYTLFDRTGMFMEYRGKGFFKGKDLGLSWQGKPLEEQELLVSFMESCQICVEVGDEYTTGDDHRKERTPFVQRTYLAPQLLPDELIANQEALFPSKSLGLYVRFRLPFLHAAIIQQFILHTYHLAHHDNIKQQRILLKQEGELALVEAFPAAKELIVQVKSDQVVVHSPLLERIRQELAHILALGESPEPMWSIDGQGYVSQAQLQAHPPQNPEIRADNGQYYLVSAFAPFLAKPAHTLPRLVSSIPQKVVQRVDEAIDYLRGNNIVGYFEVLEEVVPDQQMQKFTHFKNRFESDDLGVYFVQQLESFAKGLLKTDG